MSDSTINIYNQRATSYEKRWTQYLHHTHELFFRHIEINVGEVLLDVSGGTGLLARKLLGQGIPFHHLWVNDPSEQMLKIARKRLSRESKVSFTSYKAEQLDFEPDSFDVVFCLNSFHFYSEQLMVLKKLYTLLKPGGRLYLLDWNRKGWFRLVDRLIDWSTSAYIDTRSLPELEDMMRNCGFDIRTANQWTWRYWKFLFTESIKPS